MTLQKKISKLHRKLDALAQQYYKKKYPVSILGGKTEVMHHFIYKSQSTFLRYKEKNFIPLTAAQHFEIHHKGGIESQIVLAKGKAWHNWIKEHQSILVKKDKFYYQSLKKLEIYE